MLRPAAMKALPADASFFSDARFQILASVGCNDQLIKNLIRRGSGYRRFRADVVLLPRRVGSNTDSGFMMLIISDASFILVGLADSGIVTATLPPDCRLEQGERMPGIFTAASTTSQFTGKDGCLAVISAPFEFEY